MDTKSTVLPAYTIGKDAYLKFTEICSCLGSNLLIIGGKTALSVSRDKLLSAIKDSFNIVDIAVYGDECTGSRAHELAKTYSDKDIDFIVGVGGGKAIDTAKCLAYLLKKPVVTVPTIASNCAPTSALSVVYKDDHSFDRFWQYEKPAFHCFIDTQIIAEAPFKYIRAGIGDTLAKYYEVEFSARGRKLTYNQQFGATVSNLCREPLMASAKKAVEACMRNEINDDLERTALIIIVSTGIVSMSVGEDLNGAVAHALFYGLTNIEGFEQKFLHGDVVGYAVTVQLALDKNFDELKKVQNFLKDLNIETTLAERGITPERESFGKVLESTVNDPDMRVVPYEITKDMIFSAIEYVENV